MLEGAIIGLVNTIMDNPLIKKLIDLIPDPAEKARQALALQEELMKEASASDLAQMSIDQEEAKNENIFVSGWRPFIGWVCGVAFAYKFIMQPFIIFLLIVSGSTFDYHKLPAIEWSEMATVMLGMLGLGTMRSIEKIQGVK